MQRGAIQKERKSWFLRYWETVLVDGKPARRRVCVRLAPASDDRRTAELAADKILHPFNAKQVTPESSMLVSDFIRDIYLPYVKQELRPSTYKGYKEIFEKHLKLRLGETRLRDVRTVTVQRLLNSIDGVGHRSLLHIKSETGSE